MTFDMEEPDTQPTRVTITAHGTMVNETSSAVGVSEQDIPNFLGLDERGQSIVIELYGRYDWAPPPGQPSMGGFHLEPGASINYTAISRTWDSTVKNVRYWYSSTIPGSILLHFPGRDITCQVNGMTPAEGKAIPNVFEAGG
ncbi:hypothetical protein [Pseudarthrobacter oxydans]|uniref:hypothetical protein n=1 Tax=Pseudarthrobacter oxydans TaxID=1671 RepID=UPI0037F2D838